MAIGEIFLGAFLRLLLTRLTQVDLLNFARIKSVDKKLKKWGETLSAIEAVLYDAEEKQLKNKAVELWLNDLKHLAYDVEDLLDAFFTDMYRREVKDRNRAGTSKVRGLFSEFPKKVKFNFNMNSNIDEIANQLQDIFERKEKLGLKFIDNMSTTAKERTPSSHVLDGPVVGRDEDKRRIVELLSRDHEPGTTNFHVVAIVGMPGLGKTTLAGHVFSDGAMEQFNPQVWVSVSDDFKLVKVTKAILESIKSQYCALDELSNIQNNLRKELSGKKFLIALDDVWSTCNYDSWMKLQSPFRVGAPGSMVLVTTRDKSVAKLMGATEVYDLKTLSDEDCLQVFVQHSNCDRNFDFDELLQKKIVTKCSGLPLAAKTLGGILRCNKTEEWEEILNDKLWSISDGSDILPVLKLSYHYLPSNLKRCFAYCSIFPNDYEFGKKQLILLWMGEGLLQQPEGTRQMEDIGGNYFVDLLSRSLFQNSGKSNSRYVMHDLVGDLARWAAGDTFFRLDDKPGGICSPKTRHSAYISGKYDGLERFKYDGVKRFKAFSEAKHLRTFLPLSVSHGCENHITQNVISDLLPNLKYLRVLSFNGYQMSEVPDSIGNLRLLRYLDLSHTLIVSLPESTCMLFNLQTLILENCSKLKTLPSKMSNLTNLRHLNNSNMPSLEEMPPQLGKLTQVQTLPNFVVGKGSASGVGEIESLLHLCGTLYVRKLENVNVGDARKANLIDKKGLDALQLEWSGEGQEELKVLCSLEPHSKLQKLTLKGYSGSEFSKWIQFPSLSVMTLVKLENCENCQFLPPLGQLPSLKEVCIIGMSKVETVGPEFYGEGSLPFPVLKTLVFQDMRGWKEWLPWQRDEEIRVFPCLGKLSISRCPKLTGSLPKNIDSLSNLVIVECEQLVVSITNYKPLCELNICGCKGVLLYGSGVKFELLEAMELSSISEFRPEIEGFLRGLGKLKYLKITGCEELTFLRQDWNRWLQPWIGNSESHYVQKLLSLQQLLMIVCSKIISFPQVGWRLISNILGGNVSHSASYFFQELRSLQRLEIIGCSNLISFPDVGLPPSLEYLKIESCNYLTYFTRYQLPPSIRTIVIAVCQNLKLLVKEGELEKEESCVEFLAIKECPSLMSLSARGRLPRRLKLLRISDCKQLKSIIESFHDDACIEVIDIVGCENLESLPELCHLSNLSQLIVQQCGSLVSFPRGGLPITASKLRDISISFCGKLEALPKGMDSLRSLRNFMLAYCEGLVSSLKNLPPNLIRLIILNRYSCNKPLSEWGLDRLTSLEDLWIEGVDENLVSFPPKEMMLPRSLIKLRIAIFPNLSCLSIKAIQSLTSLESLSIRSCPKLAFIPEEERLPLSLKRLLIVGNCPVLRERYQPGKGRHWPKIAHIPYVYVGDDTWDAEAAHYVSLT